MTVIQSRKIRRVEHVPHVGENSSAPRVLVIAPKRIRPLRIPRRT